MSNNDEIRRPVDPHPTLFKCPLCDYWMTRRVEYYVHIEQEHQRICPHCLESTRFEVNLWDDTGKAVVDERTEHMISKHPDMCPICKTDEKFNFSRKILHLRKWHSTDPVIMKEGIGYYLR